MSKNRNELIDSLRVGIEKGATESAKNKKKGIYNLNYQAFANVYWYELGLPQAEGLANNHRHDHNLDETKSLVLNENNINALIDWAIKQNRERWDEWKRKNPDFNTDPENSDQFTEKHIDDIESTIHCAFAKHSRILTGIKTVKVKEGDVFYRGVSYNRQSSHTPERFNAEIEGQLRDGLSHHPFNSRFRYKIRTKWLKTERNSVAVSTTTDPSMGIKYARCKDNPEGGWIYVIRPPEGAEAVSLAHYRSRGSAFRELVFDDIPNDWIKEVVHVRSDRNGVYVDEIIKNPNYRNANVQTRFDDDNKVIPDRRLNTFPGERLFDTLNTFNTVDQNLDEDKRNNARLVNTTSLPQRFSNQLLRLKNRWFDKGGLQEFTYEVKSNNKTIQSYNFENENELYLDRFKKAKQDEYDGSPGHSKRKPPFKTPEHFRQLQNSSGIAARAERECGGTISVPADDVIAQPSISGVDNAPLPGSPYPGYTPYRPINDRYHSASGFGGDVNMAGIIGGGALLALAFVLFAFIPFMAAIILAAPLAAAGIYAIANSLDSDTAPSRPYTARSDISVSRSRDRDQALSDNNIANSVAPSHATTTGRESSYWANHVASGRGADDSRVR